MAIPPEGEPALLAQLEVTGSCAVQTAAARGAGLHLARELDLTSKGGRQLR